MAGSGGPYSIAGEYGNDTDRIQVYKTSATQISHPGSWLLLSVGIIFGIIAFIKGLMSFSLVQKGVNPHCKDSKVLPFV